ncbi:MAG TPA: 50S ribosomal protein L6 [Phycisphaerales bacterium]|nr:50S ribosomal protein L6 [Phycisphaerales bacterium]
MSRIGKKPIPVPAGVKVAINGQKIGVEGPKGKLAFDVRPEVKIAWTESEKAIRVEQAQGVTDDDRAARAHWGTTRALIRNMVEGVTKGYEKNLQVVGTGWSAAVQGKQLKVVAGLANPLMFPIPDGITVTVDKAQGDTTPVKIVGTDRQAVGQFAAMIRARRKPEPYNGKGIKYAEEVIKRKQGKQFGA